jgi:hypothetical protein
MIMSFLRRWLSWSIDWTVQKNPSKEQGRVVKYSREQGRIGCAAWIALGNARAREAIPGPRARVGLGLCACAALHGFELHSRSTTPGYRAVGLDR